MKLQREGRIESLRIVAKDEAEPAQGKLSWVSPLAQALTGLGESDTIEFAGCSIEILAVANPAQ